MINNRVIVNRPTTGWGGLATWGKGTVTPAAAQAARITGGHPKMTITAEGGFAMVVPYAPSTSNHEGIAPDFAVVPRGGRKPLLLESAESLESMSFDLILGHFSPNQSVEGALGKIRRLAESGARMRVKLDSSTSSGQWRITAFSYQVLGRQHGTNAVTRAVCSVTFTRVSDPVVAVGPVSGGKGGKGPKQRPKFYVWKRGDSLASVADRFYGTDKAWRKIAKANKIRDSRTIKPGDKLRLP